MKKFNFKIQSGFTFIELIVAIGITVVIAMIGFLNLYNFRSESELDLTVREIISIFRNAQDRSISQEDGVQWGVYLENPSSGDSYYLLYKGVITTVVSKSALRSNIQFLDPVSNSNKNVLFSFLSGLPIINGIPNSSTTIKIAFKNDSSKVRVISINSNGQIDFSSIYLALECPSSVQDVDGNTYNTVLINNQCWMRENMRTTKYPNGSSITYGCDTALGCGVWGTDNAYYSCPPNISNDGPDCAAALPPTNLGYLYQWSAVMNGATIEGAQGICPNGWHIPKDSEQHVLDYYLSTGSCDPNRIIGDCDPAGTKLRLSGGANFNALLVGYRSITGSFISRGTATGFQSSLQNGSSVWSRYILNGPTTVTRFYYSKARGLSVRCLKN